VENIEIKLNVLSKIAKKLNSKDATWAVGASMLLYFKGIVSEFNDIDIMVAEEDAEVLKDILLSLGNMQTSSPNFKCRSKCFWKFNVDGVDIDVMSGFSIIDNDKEYYFPLKAEDIKDYTEVDGVKIPLQSVEEWRIYYKLMGRDAKVKMIDVWLQTQSFL